MAPDAASEVRITAAVQMSAPADDVFAKVRAMIEEMIAKLMQEAADEADHKARWGQA